MIILRKHFLTSNRNCGGVSTEVLHPVFLRIRLHFYVGFTKNIMFCDFLFAFLDDVAL